MDDILALSLERWGTAGSARYLALLRAALRKIAAQPLGPTTLARDEITAGIRSLHLKHVRSRGVSSPVHVLYFRLAAPGVVEIVRVLHERMDPRRHFEDQ